MPEICRFFGIIITMYWERNARHHSPHFHAKYNGNTCTFSLPGLKVMEGSLPPTAMRLIKRWAKLHLPELMENWNLASKDKPINTISPLI